MITIIAIDALEYELVEAFNTTSLKLDHYGKTDISEFSQPRTMVLWSSFMTGENREAEILAKGDKEMWNTRIPHNETFFSRFDNPLYRAFDLNRLIQGGDRELEEKIRTDIEGFGCFDERAAAADVLCVVRKKGIQTSILYFELYRRTRIFTLFVFGVIFEICHVISRLSRCYPT